MSILENDVTKILAYVQVAKEKGRNECVYPVDTLSGLIYKVVLLLKERLPEHNVWYVDPIAPQTPLSCNEECGIHIEWV
jgi:hypothetical protein